MLSIGLQYPLQLAANDGGTLRIARDAADIWNQRCASQASSMPTIHTDTCSILIQIIVKDAWSSLEVHRSVGTLVYLRYPSIERRDAAAAALVSPSRLGGTVGLAVGSIINDWFSFPTAGCTSGTSSCGKI